MVPVDTTIVPQQGLTVNTRPVIEGEDVFVISSPMGLPGVVSTGLLFLFYLNCQSLSQSRLALGIIAAVHNEYDIQISCAISTGSSGAPIFNRHGEVVGVVSGHLTDGQSLNFGLTVKVRRLFFSANSVLILIRLATVFILENSLCSSPRSLKSREP